MKTRFLIRVYKIESVLEYPQGRDDIDEQTEDQLSESRDFQYQIQANSLQEIGAELLKR